MRTVIMYSYTAWMRLVEKEKVRPQNVEEVGRECEGRVDCRTRAVVGSTAASMWRTTCCLSTTTRQHLVVLALQLPHCYLPFQACRHTNSSQTSSIDKVHSSSVEEVCLCGVGLCAWLSGFSSGPRQDLLDIAKDVHSSPSNSYGTTSK